MTMILLFVKERVMSPQESIGLPYWFIALSFVACSVWMFVSIELHMWFCHWRKHKQVSGRYQALASSADQQAFIQNEISLVQNADESDQLLTVFRKLGILLTDEQQAQLLEKGLEAATAH
jgi:hypothetical protein